MKANRISLIHDTCNHIYRYAAGIVKARRKMLGVIFIVLTLIYARDIYNHLTASQQKWMVHMRTASSAINKNMYNEALEEFNQALIESNKFARDDTRLAETYLAYAICISKSIESPNTVKQIQNRKNVLVDILTSEGEPLKAATDSYSCYNNVKKLRKACKYLRKSISIYEQYDVQYDMNIAHALVWLSYIEILYFNDYGKLNTDLARAIQILDNSSVITNREIPSLLGIIYRLLKTQNSKSVLIDEDDLILCIVHIKEIIDGKYHPSLALRYYDLYIYYRQNKQFDDAELYFINYEISIEKHYNPSDLEFILRNILGERIGFYLEYNRYDKIEHSFKKMVDKYIYYYGDNSEKTHRMIKAYNVYKKHRIIDDYIGMYLSNK